MSEARRQFNSESLELWLGAYAGGYTYPRDDSEQNNPNKKGSRIPINMIWMQAMSDPEVKETDECLKRVFEKMEREQPVFYRIFEHLYFREEASPSDTERWRQLARKINVGETATTSPELGGDLKAHGYWELYEMFLKAREWALDQVEKDQGCGSVLVVPDAMDPVGFVKRSEKFQRIAKRVFWKNVYSVGESEARKKAAQASGFSVRHVRNLLPPGISKEPDTTER